jgi:hypothetical protein
VLVDELIQNKQGRIKHRETSIPRGWCAHDMSTARASVLLHFSPEEQMMAAEKQQRELRHRRTSLFPLSSIDLREVED